MSSFDDMDVDEIVAVYAAAAAQQRHASDHGHAQAAKAAFDAMSGAYRELRMRGPESQSALLVLLHHEDPAVRFAAAAHALEFAPEEGEPVLAELAAADETSVGFDAAMTLEVWREGELRFP